MRHLIIPDIHQQIDAVQYLLKREAKNYDSVCFLGDYFDSFDKTTNQITTSHALREWMEKNDNWTFLLGNHDIFYFSQAYTSYWCSGNHIGRRDNVREILMPYSSQFKLSTKIGSFFVSHAGVHPGFVPPVFDGDIYDVLSKLSDNAYNLIHTHNVPLLMAGRDRGGSQRFGGLTWCDWNNLAHIPGVNQIVGHTNSPNNWRKDVTEDSIHICLDSDCCYAAIVDDTIEDPENSIEIIRWCDEPLQLKAR